MKRTYDIRRTAFSVSPVPSTPRRHAAVRFSGVLAGFSQAFQALLRGISAPFRDNFRSPPDRFDLGLNISFATLNDKLWAVSLLILFILAVVIVAVWYGDAKGFPFWRIMLAVIGTCFAGSLAAVYLRHLFDRTLGRTASQIVSYSIAAFVAILAGSLLLGL